ncbi:MAG TPA: Holliday junction resolvase RuvX [Chloroflexota bacterium]|nr:Holliday junction resolvase RuvX [Chloroflexota bacterium]
MPPGRTLCLDVGERRIGVALSDPEGRLASPLGVIVRRNASRDFEQVAQLVQQHGVERVVVGLPRTLAGELGPQARRVQRWAERLRAHLPVPLVYWDERYSTIEAARRLAASGSRRRRTALDAAAAAVILQDYLDTAR